MSMLKYQIQHFCFIKWHACHLAWRANSEAPFLEWIDVWLMNQMDKHFVRQMTFLCAASTAECFPKCFIFWFKMLSAYLYLTYSRLRVVKNKSSDGTVRSYQWKRSCGKGYAEVNVPNAVLVTGHLVIQKIFKISWNIVFIWSGYWINKHGTTKACPSVIRVHPRLGPSLQLMAAFQTGTKDVSTVHTMTINYVYGLDRQIPAALRCKSLFHRFIDVFATQYLTCQLFGVCTETKHFPSTNHRRMYQYHFESAASTECSWPGRSQTSLQTWKTLKVYSQ